MTTKKKGYVKPIIATEEFVPQEYVAACVGEYGETQYQLACQATSYPWSQHIDCKSPDAYTITIDRNGYITSIWERPNDSGNFDEGGYASNIKINGQDSSGYPLTDKNAIYNITWTTDVGYDMQHTGTIKLSTAIVVNMS